MLEKFMSIGMSDEILEWQSGEHNIPVDVISELLDAASIYVDGDKFNEVVARAWIEGYEAKKEPLYQVRLNNLFFFGWGELGVQPTFNQSFARKQAKKWSEKKDAEKVAEIIGGVVVEANE